jgi:PAS domain S-box-containing protein
MVDNTGLNQKGGHQSARDKFLSLSLESTRKSYYPQLQKQLEIAKEIAEKYRQIVEYAPAGIYEFDMEKMRFISVNDVMCEYTGYTKKEFLELDPFLLLAEDSQKKLKELLNEVFAGNQNPEPVEYKIIGKNNREICVLVNTRFFFEKDSPIKATAVVHDLTAIRKAEEEKKRLEAQLHQAQKMESIGILAGGIAHNFNNVLMGIQGRVSLMMIDKDPSDPDFEHLKEIEAYAKSAAELTKDLLGFARGGKYEVKPIDLNVLIKHESMMFGRTKKEIRFHVRYERDLWLVEADQGQIQQVFLNLYVNAWQAMPGGGDLYIQTENVTLDAQYVKHFDIRPGKYIKISLTDTGTGMDEATKEKIFDPFFSTKDSGKGFGLGLASVYGIIKNHGGFINVYSEKGIGTTFNIYLPASDKEIDKESIRHNEIAIQHGKGTVLLVDDEDMITDVGRMMLEKLGYRVLIARNGKEALDAYDKQKEEIDLVILDMIMPGLGGGEIFDQLKKLDGDVNVLLSSGYTINGQAKEIMDRGCRGFIQKPYSLEELSNKIIEVFAKSKK